MRRRLPNTCSSNAEACLELGTKFAFGVIFLPPLHPLKHSSIGSGLEVKDRGLEERHSGSDWLHRFIYCGRREMIFSGT
ncbi:hypothetical protein Dimus_012392, partial [Dionaea muscipula]